MTVAVAVKKNGRTVLAADSLVNFGGQRYSAANCRFHKIHHIGDSVLAWAGWSLYAELLGAHLATGPASPELYTEQQVFAFFIGFSRVLRDEYAFRRARGGEAEHPFADLDSTFLVANKAGIFRVSSDMDVTEFQQYAAVGSGSKYALGALRVLYDQLEDAAMIAERGVLVGIEFDVYCGGIVDLAEGGAGPPMQKPSELK